MLVDQLKKRLGHRTGLEDKESIRTLSKCKVKTEMAIKRENKQLEENGKRPNIYYILFLSSYFICNICSLLACTSFSIF